MKRLTKILFSVISLSLLVLGACTPKASPSGSSQSSEGSSGGEVSSESSLEESSSSSEEHVHSWSDEWEKDDTNHWHTCSSCDEKGELAAHVYDDDHDATCNVCGYTRSLGDHFPAVVLSHDGTHHWYACNHEGCDLKYEYVEHSYDDDHDTICDACGYARELGDHGPERDWTHDEVGHWHACQHEGCEIKYDYAMHSFDDDHDATCDCGYTRDLGDHTPKSAWSHDKLHHWHACNHPGCEYKFDYGEHHCIATGKCVVCEINIADDFTIDKSTESVVINYGHLDAGTYFFRVSEFRNEYDYCLRFPHDALVKCHYYATEGATEFSTVSYNCSFREGTVVPLPRSVSYHTTFVFEFTIDDVPGHYYDSIRIWAPYFES